MKKLVLSAAIFGLIFATSCSKDDDGGSNACITCDAMGQVSEHCDNGDGRVAITANGQTTYMELEDMTFQQYAQFMRDSGYCE